MDREAVRAKLKEIGRAKTRSAAVAAGVSPETVDKFRRGWITDMGGEKLLKLISVLALNPAPQGKTQKARA